MKSFYDIRHGLFGLCRTIVSGDAVRDMRIDSGSFSGDCGPEAYIELNDGTVIGGTLSNWEDISPPYAGAKDKGPNS